MAYEYHSSDGEENRNVIFFSDVKVLRKWGGNMIIHYSHLGKIALRADDSESTFDNFSDYLQKKDIKFYRGDGIIVVFDDLISMKLTNSKLTLIYKDKATAIIGDLRTENLKTIYKEVLETRLKFDL